MKPLAILTSDWHFSAVVPAARSAEPDWLAAQKRVIDELAGLQKSLGDVPIIVAGDLFDKWHAPSATYELTNFLIDTLPDKIIAIPGQHDLPCHSYSDRHRSPYGTLVRAGKIVDLKPGCPCVRGQLVLHGFPWGYPVEPFTGNTEGFIHLAVVHAYIWQVGYSYKDAPKDQHADYYKAKLAGFDCAVFGDNHSSFMLGTKILNSGTIMRRKSDERSYKPRVGILYDDAHIEQHFLDVSKDLWLEETAVASDSGSQDFDASGFITSLNGLGPDSLDFRAAVNRCMDQRKVDADVRRIVTEVVP